jgi:hypothetical protein
MTELRGIDRLSPEEQVKIYKDLAAHYESMTSLASAEGAKLIFNDMRREMLERADAVIAVAPAAPIGD